MKIKLPLIFLLIFSFVDAQVPSTWDSTTLYSSGALALDSNGVTYIAQQESTGIALSDTTYWQSLDAAAPTSSPSTSAPTSTPDTSTVPTTTPDTNETSVSRFLGISTRGLVSSTKAMYGSIAITGTENKTVAFMGKGKTMESQGITDYVADPALIIYKLTNGAWGVYRTIDNWGDATGTENISTVDGSEGITLPVDANEAAIVLDLEPGNYSAILTSTEATEKEALVEAYEIVE